MIATDTRTQGLNLTPKCGAHVYVRDLSHTYRHADGLVLSGLNFQIAPGEVLAVLGRSGCGKSTLLHMLAGLAMPSQGSVTINDRQVTGPSNRWVMMFQEPSLYPWMNVTRNAGIGLQFSRSGASRAQRVADMLKLVDLNAFADRNVQDLSGGQQQRVALARSLAMDPEMLLLDEPFSALDAFTRRALQRDVRRIAHDLGLTLVIVTHNVSEALRMADRILVLDAHPGRIAREVDVSLTEAERTGGCAQFTNAQAELMNIYTTVAHGLAEDAGPGLSQAG